jgi:hypothetical protein
METSIKKQSSVWATFYQRLNGPLHKRALWLFMVIVFFHWVEHVAQIYQIYIWGWTPKQAGGGLGLVFPSLVDSEVLHTSYNLLLWSGVFLLRAGFQGTARRWWMVALAAQSWHFFEHILLQVQWMTGYYLFGASQQISILQPWFPRPELHFAYNLIVFVPLMLGMFYHFSPPGDRSNSTTEAGLSQA